MNKSIATRGGLIAVAAGSALLLAPFTAGAANHRGELVVRQSAAVADGQAVAGHLAGTRLHEHGRVVDSTESSFRGSIRLTP
jgi:hypothetical protein